MFGQPDQPMFSDHILYIVKLYYIRNTYSLAVNK